MSSNSRVALPPAGLLLVVFMVFSCAKPPADPFCTYEALPSSTEVPAGQGAVLIIAPADDYLYVFDATGHQVQSGPSNRALNLKPGQYDIKLNNSVHSTRVESKMLTKCSASALRVSGDTDDYYYVFNAAKTQLANQKLGRPIIFFPGAYAVTVNKVPGDAKLASGATTDLKTGTLNVLGTTDEYYYVFDAAGTQLANSKLSRALSFLPGSLTVKVNGTSAQVNVTPGAVTEVATGALLVQGTTDEYYYVFDHIGNQLANNKLGRALSFVPGNYSVKVNNTSLPAAVEAGKTNEYPTGTLTVKRTGDDYYYVLDGNGTQLANNKTDRSLALAAGKYSVKIGSDTRPVTITAGEATVLNW